MGAAALVSPAFGAADATLSGPVKVAARRVTESQYRHIVADIFGSDVKLNARFEPERREDGLLAVGSAQLSITTSGFEQYFALGKSISDQVLDPKRRDASVGCRPADLTKPDDACATAFIRRYGDQLFRRPMTAAEVAARVGVARKGAETGDFYSGLKLTLTSLLVAPEFLFRIEEAEPDPATGKARLNGYTKASRLSFLFWDSAPDAELLAAAKSGALHTPAGLNAQLARLSASPRLQDGARAFFSDMLQLDAFESLTKDPAAYPKFSQAIADSAREETLRTVVDLLVVKNRDYRDVFTTNETILNRHLAAVYKAPFSGVNEWTTYTFPASAERSGILTEVTFLSLNAHPAASSPTKRGVKLHEIFMCQPTPDPPADVDFSKVQALDKGTVRTRLLDHMSNPGCVTCHRVSDPAGLALEHFDGLGQLRTTENNNLIDVSADIGGAKLVGAKGLGKMLHDSPLTSACLVNNVYAYGVGRAVDDDDDAYLAAQTKAFAAGSYRLNALFTAIAASPEFFKPVLPAGAQPAMPAARVALGDVKPSSGGAQ
ncbi:hypothetical protein BH11PSE2_BH11PSE2_16210 [soil metagenome]